MNDDVDNEVIDWLSDAVNFVNKKNKNKNKKKQKR